MLEKANQPKSTDNAGIELETIDWGLESSSQAQEGIPEITRLVMKEIEETKRDELHWH